MGLAATEDSRLCDLTWIFFKWRVIYWCHQLIQLLLRMYANYTILDGWVQLSREHRWVLQFQWFTRWKMAHLMGNSSYTCKNTLGWLQGRQLGATLRWCSLPKRRRRCGCSQLLYLIKRLWDLAGVIFIHAQESCPLNLFSAVAVQAAVWRSVVRIYSKAAARLLHEGLGCESPLRSLHVLPVRMWVFFEHSSFLPKVQKHTC